MQFTNSRVILPTIFLIVGMLSLFSHFQAENIVGIFLYLIAMIAISYASSKFCSLIEYSLIKHEQIKASFAESVFWLLLCIFVFYQFNKVELQLLKISLGIIVFLLVIIFLLKFVGAIKDTPIFKKKINIFIALLLQFFVIVLTSYLTDRLEPLTYLWPILFIVSYSYYILVEFLKSDKLPNITWDKSSPSIPLLKLRSERSFANVKLYLKQADLLNLGLILFLSIIMILYIKNILPLRDNIVELYSISISTYVVLLSIIAGLSIVYLSRKSNDEQFNDLKRPIIGLVQMCIFYMMLSIVGFILGINNDMELFAKGTIINCKEIISNLYMICQILVFQIVVYSFPSTLMYIYAILKGWSGNSKNSLRI